MAAVAGAVEEQDRAAGELSAAARRRLRRRLRLDRRGRPRRRAAARRGAGPLAGLRRHGGVDALAAELGRAAAGPARRRAHRPPHPGRGPLRARWRPAWPRCCGRRPTAPPSGPSGPGARCPAGPRCSAEEADALSRVSADFPEAAAAQVRDWQGGVLDLVRELGADKRTRARLTSWGVNGAGAVVMVAVFASTGGLTGVEVAVAGGTTALGQRVLEALLGDAAVRSLADRAREDLLSRTDQLLQTERDRFDDRVAAVAPGRGRRGRAAAGGDRRSRPRCGRADEDPGGAAGRPPGGAAGGGGRRRRAAGGAGGGRGAAARARCWRRPAPGRRWARRPSWPWPGRPAAASPRCSTPCPGPR